MSGRTIGRFGLSAKTRTKRYEFSNDEDSRAPRAPWARPRGRRRSVAASRSPRYARVSLPPSTRARVVVAPPRAFVRRPARPRDRARGCLPPAAGVARSLLALRARVDAKYVTEVERRSEMATDAADARDAADAARRERDDAEPGRNARNARQNRTRGRRRDRVTFEETRARDARGGNRRSGGRSRREPLARSRNETPPKHAARAAERARARTGGGGDRAAHAPRRARGRAAERAPPRRRSGALRGRGCRGGARAEARDETRRRCGETRTTNAPASNADSRRRAAKTQRLARRRRRLKRGRGWRKRRAAHSALAASAAARADAAETETRRATARYATLVAELEATRARLTVALEAAARADDDADDANSERFRNMSSRTERRGGGAGGLTDGVRERDATAATNGLSDETNDLVPSLVVCDAYAFVARLAASAGRERAARRDTAARGARGAGGSASARRRRRRARRVVRQNTAARAAALAVALERCASRTRTPRPRVARSPRATRRLYAREAPPSTERMSARRRGRRRLRPSAPARRRRRRRPSVRSRRLREPPLGQRVARGLGARVSPAWNGGLGGAAARLGPATAATTRRRLDSAAAESAASASARDAVRECVSRARRGGVSRTAGLRETLRREVKRASRASVAPLAARRARCPRVFSAPRRRRRRARRGPPSSASAAEVAQALTSLEEHISETRNARTTARGAEAVRASESFRRGEVVGRRRLSGRRTRRAGRAETERGRGGGGGGGGGGGAS